MSEPNISPTPRKAEPEEEANAELARVKAEFSRQVAIAKGQPVSDTPRTDDNAFGQRESWVPATFARQLERELAQAQADVTSMRQANEIANASADDQMFQKRKAEAELAELILAVKHRGAQE